MPNGKPGFPRKSLALLGVLALMLVFMACLSAGSASAAGPTYVYEDINSDMEWSEDDSPYIVNASFAIGEGYTLTIGPNVTVLCDPGVVITVDGALVAEGTADKMITFTENQTGLMWEGLSFTYTSVGSMLDFVRMDNATQAVWVNNCTVPITNCMFLDGSNEAIVFMLTDSAPVTVTGCTFNYGYYNAIFISQSISTADEESKAIDCPIDISGNDFSGYGRVLNLMRSIIAMDNSTASITGDVFVQYNTMNMTSGDWNSIRYDVTIHSYGNASATVQGDFMVSDNDLVQTGYVFLNPRIEMWAYNENSSVTYDGDFMVCDNTLADLDGYVLDNSVYYMSSGYAAIALISDIIVSGNTLENCYYDFVGVSYTLSSYDNSTVDVIRDITVADNIIEQVGNLFDYDMENGAYDDSVVTIQGDVLILNNIVDDARNRVLNAYFGAYAADRGHFSMAGSLLFEDNQVNCSNFGGTPAISIYRMADAIGEAVSEVNVEVCVLDNVLDYISYSGIYLDDYASAEDDATAALLGEVTISGNLLSTEMPVAPAAPPGPQNAGVGVERTFEFDVNGTVVFASSIVVENNDFVGGLYGIYVQVVADYYTANMENTTFDYISDLLVSGNSFSYIYGDAFRYDVDVESDWYGEVIYSSAVSFDHNIVEDIYGYACYISQIFSADDHSELNVLFPVFVFNNTVTEAAGLLYYGAQYFADNMAVLDYLGDVSVLRNECEYLDSAMIRYAVEGDADDMASVLIENALLVSDNNGFVDDDAISYLVEIDASESASIEALMPLTVTSNTFMVSGSMVSADVDCSVWENATAVLFNDVLVQGNSMDNRYFVILSEAPAGPSYSGYGLKLFQYMSVESDDVLASALIESEVLFDDNTIEGFNLVGMNVYRNADAEAFYSDAVALIVGDVTATNNIISIMGSGCGLAGGAEVDADAIMGNATATVATLFCFSQNKLTMEWGHGIVAYAEDDGYDYEGEYYSDISTLDLEYVIEDNCINGIGALLTAPSVGPALTGLLVDAEMGVPVWVSDNTFDLETGTAIVIESGEVTVVRTDIVVEYGSGIEIIGGNVTVDGNSIEASVYGILVMADGVVLVDNFILMTQGTGVMLQFVSDVVIEDSIISGSEVGLRVTYSFNVTVARNAINNNDIGVWADETGNLSFCNNWVTYNNNNGAQFHDCWNLWIEYNLFANNQGDGAYISGDGYMPTARDGDENPWTIVGNNTFDQNWDDGLDVYECDTLIIYNGVYTDNSDYGLNVYYCVEAKWIVDGVSEVRNNGVLLYGADLYVQEGGKITLDYVTNFYISAYGTDVLSPVEFGDERAKIDIDLGGEMVARNTNFYSYNGYYFFDVYGTLKMMNCYVSGIVQLYIGEGSTVLLDSSTISDASRNCITIDNSSPIIRGCIIRYANMDGIFIQGADAKPVIKNCLIYGNERGIYARDTCLDKVIDNIFLSNYMAGIYAENVNGAIHDNVFLFNQNEIFVIDSTVVVEDNQIGYSRLINGASPYASVIMTVIMDMLKVNVNIDVAELMYGPYPPSAMPGPASMLMDAIVYMMMDNHVGIYSVGSTVHASGNEYGSLQYAVYAIDSTLVFKDTVKTNYFTLSWYGANGTKYVFDLPFTVYDGIFATNSNVKVMGASIQCLDDAIFLEDCTAEIADTTFDAGDFDIYIMEGSTVRVHGCEWEKIKVLDVSVMYVEHLLTLTVKDQNGFGIAGASVNITDAAGKVWATGVSDGKGVFKVYLPSFAILADGQHNTSINPFKVSATKDNATGTGNFVMEDKATSAGVTVAMKKNTVFGMDPLVIGGIALVIAVVLIGALYFARKK